MRTVVETPIFSRQADKLFSASERRAIIDLLASDPLAGEEIPGTGGVRKVRVPASGRGKRGGGRLIFFWPGLVAPLYAPLVYAKGERIDMTPAEKKAVAALASALRAQFRSE